VSGARHYDEMSDRIPASHAEHDPLLVAALAAGDLEPADRLLVERLASCPECALLAADLRAIATATAALPPRTRPRDFSLRAEDAARLRRRGWRGFVAAFGGRRSAALKPLATGLTTLGIAGLLLAALPAVPLGGPGAAQQGAAAPTGSSRDVKEVYTDTAGGAIESGAPPRAVADYSQQPGASREPVPVTGPLASPLEVDAPAAQPGAGAPTATGPSPLAVLSGALLVLGLGLFGLRWTARRLVDG
jgi:anti-sigma factor RsiW